MKFHLELNDAAANQATWEERVKQNCVKILRVPLLRHCTWWVYFGDVATVGVMMEHGSCDICNCYLHSWVEGSFWRVSSQSRTASPLPWSRASSTESASIPELDLCSNIFVADFWAEFLVLITHHLLSYWRWRWQFQRQPKWSILQETKSRKHLKRSSWSQRQQQSHCFSALNSNWAHLEIISFYDWSKRVTFWCDWFCDEEKENNFVTLVSCILHLSPVETLAIKWKPLFNLYFIANLGYRADKGGIF